MSDQQVDVFLEHHGVKGQKWGIRNQQQLDRVSRVVRGTELKKKNQAQWVIPKQKVVRGLEIAGGAAAAVGATALVATLLARHGMVPASQAKFSSKLGRAFVDMHKHVRMRQIRQNRKLIAGIGAVAAGKILSDRMKQNRRNVTG